MGSKFSVLLRELRLERRHSVRELAARAGVGKSTLSDWETGASRPRLPEMEAVLSALGANPAVRAEALAGLDAPRAARQIRAEMVQQDPLIGTVPGGGDLLRAMRLRRRCSLGRIAQAIGISPATLSRWERGEVTPPADRWNALLDVLGAHPQERAALADQAWFARASPAEAAPSADALYAALTALLAVTAETAPWLTDLHFFTLERKAWPLAARHAGAREILAETFARHGQHLSSWDRFAESGHYAARALALQKDSRYPTPSALRAGSVAARAAVYSGRRTAPTRGLAGLDHWRAAAHAPGTASWMWADTATYRAMAGEFPGALAAAEEACHLAKSVSEDMIQARRVDQARILLWAGRPADSLTLLASHEEARPRARAEKTLMRAEALLALGDRPAAEGDLLRAQVLITAHALQPLQRRVDSLTQRASMSAIRPALPTSPAKPGIITPD